MKRKLNARTLTLILLISALICAVFAGLAFAILNTDISEENVNYISKPESSVSPTWIDAGDTKDDGYDDWYDEDDSHYYWVEYDAPRVEVNGTITIEAKSDDYTVYLELMGVSYKVLSNESNRKYYIQPTEVGSLYARANSSNGCSYDVEIRVTPPITSPKEETLNSDGTYNYGWFEYESGAMHISDTQTIYAVTDDQDSDSSRYVWSISGPGTIIAGGNGYDYVTIKGTAEGNIWVEVDYGSFGSGSICIRVTSNIIEGLVTCYGNAYWHEFASKTMKVGETQTVYYYTTDSSINASDIFWENRWGGCAKVVDGGNGFNYITFEALKVGTIVGWELWAAPTETNAFQITVQKGDYDMSDASWDYSSAFTYDGNTKTVALTGLPKGVTANYSNNSKSAAGTYTASVSSWNYDSTNYNTPSSVSNLSWTINRAGMSQPTLSKSSATYSQNSQTLTISTTTNIGNISLPSGWSRSGTTITIPGGTAVGSYNVSVTPDSNHKWSDNTTTAKTLSVSITASSITSGTITLSQTSLVYSGGELKPTVSSVKVGSETLPTSDYTVAYTNNIIVGTATVTITAKNNYKDSCSTTFTITKAMPTANPVIAAGTYVSGNSLNTVGIFGAASFNGSTLSGTFYWTDPSTILQLGSASYEWTFEPSDTHNFNNVTGNATVAAVGMDYITVTGAKTKYKAYESFTQTGMTVNAVAGSASRPVTGYTLDIPYTQDGRNYFLVSDSGCEITVTYTEGGKTATTTIVITVEKADYDMSGVTMTDNTVTYDGGEHSITYAGTLPTGVHFNKYTYGGEALTGVTNAGTYAVAVLFTIDDAANYNVPELTATLVINKATPTATANILSGTYYVGDGLSGVTISVGTSSVGGSVAWTNSSGTITGTADSYGWTFTPADTDNYNTVTGVAQVTAYYKLTGITVTGAKTSYKAHESFDTTGMTVTASYAVGKADTAVTGYDVSYPTEGATEFVISDDGKSMTVTYTENGKTATAYIGITIIANEYDMSGVTMNDVTVTYDGETHSVTITGNLPDGVTVTGYTYNGASATGATNAGTYNVVAVIEIADPDNYKLPELSATLIINKAGSTLDVSGVETEYVYTGSLQTVDGGATVDNGEQTIVYTNNTFTTVAEGNGLIITISVAESDNYLSATKTVTITVKKATPTLDVSGVETEYVYTGSLQTVESGATVDNGEQTIVYTNNTFTTVAEGDGLVITISVAESDNYLSASKTVTITVDKATVENSVTFTDKTVTYDGKTHTLTLDGTLADDITVTYYYYGTTDEFTGEAEVKYDGNAVAGYKVTAHFECTSGNYNDPTDMTATLTINPYTVDDGEVGGINGKYAYKGEAWKPEPEVEVTLADGKLTLDSGNYTVEYSTEDYVAGTQVTVKVTFGGNYAGTVEKEFEIVKAKIEIEWSEGDYTYNGMRQGVSVTGVKGLAAKDAATPVVKYAGRGTTSYEESVSKPVNAGLYTVTAELDENLFDNYEYSEGNILSKQFEIKKANISVNVDFKSSATGTLYAGGGLPEIEVKGDATAGSFTVTGKLAWQQTGDEPPALDLGTNDYVWIFTPDDGDNFNVKTGTISITAEQATIISLTVDWRTDIDIPEIYTSTTLSEVREYLVVTGELAGNLGFVEIIGYQITGSWGSEPNPAADKAGTYFYTVAFNGKRATLLNVVYNAILIVDLKVEAAKPDGITKTYDGLDEFDRSSIKVTVVYNDGTENVVEDYKVIYNDGHSELWAGDKRVIISYNNGSLEADIERVIDGLTVNMNDYDMSGITVGDLTTDFDGSIKGYVIKGEFTIGEATYTYAKLNNDGEWQTVPAASVKDAGTYRVTVKFTVTEEKYIANYYEVQSRQVTLVINKVDYAGVDDIGFVTTNTDYEFGNSVANKITVQNVPQGVNVTYEYKNSNGEVISADEVVNAGEYAVTVKFGVDDNHYAIAPITISFTVNKIKPTVNPTVGGSLSQGTLLYQLMLMADDGDTAGTFAWVNDEQELRAGINRCYYTFTPEDTVNYETVKGYIDLNAGALAEDGAKGNGTLSSGVTAAIIICIAVSLLVAVLALIVAARKPKIVNADAGGFYDDATEDDMK